MKQALWIAIALVLLIGIGGSAWYVFFRPTSQLVSTLPTSVDFGEATDREGVSGGNEPLIDESTTNQPFAPTQAALNSQVFQIAEGPIVGALLIQTTRPTTTLARFIKADSGRVFDIPLDVAGALPRAVSNTTIPGLQRVLWLPGGLGALVQYESEGVRKTLYLGLKTPDAVLSATTTPAPTKIQYLPDNIIDLALSPDGQSVVYLLKTVSGIDGSVARSDGTAPKKLFSSPLSHVNISWPSNTIMLLQTRSSSDSLGAAFSIDARTGVQTPLFFANGINSIADRNFARIIYQSILPSGLRTTLVRDLARNRDSGLSFSPLPNKCTWSSTGTSTLYCATPLGSVPVNYFDLWNLGIAGAADTLVSYNLSTGASLLRATPGNKNVGAASDMVELSVSPDDHYLTFVRKGERTLWGVRLVSQ